MDAIPEPARALLENDGLAHLVTVNPDGSPQMSCVWVGPEGDELVIASLGGRPKLRNVERDPRVSLSVEAKATNDLGMVEYLVVHGRGRVEEGGARAAAAAGRHLHRPRGVLPADGRPAARLRAAHRAGALRRRRPLDLTWTCRAGLRLVPPVQTSSTKVNDARRPLPLGRRSPSRSSGRKMPSLLLAGSSGK